MGRTACTEPQCLYSRAIPLLPYGPYGLYRASVPVQGCTLFSTTETVTQTILNVTLHINWLSYEISFYIYCIGKKISVNLERFKLSGRNQFLLFVIDV
jgi:hypothetical protein